MKTAHKVKVFVLSSRTIDLILKVGLWTLLPKATFRSYVYSFTVTRQQVKHGSVKTSDEDSRASNQG